MTLPTNNQGYKPIPRQKPAVTSKVTRPLFGMPAAAKDRVSGKYVVEPGKTHSAGK